MVNNARPVRRTGRRLRESTAQRSQPYVVYESLLQPRVTLNNDLGARAWFVRACVRAWCALVCVDDDDRGVAHARMRGCFSCSAYCKSISSALAIWHCGGRGDGRGFHFTHRRTAHYYPRHSSRNTRYRRTPLFLVIFHATARFRSLVFSAIYVVLFETPGYLTLDGVCVMEGHTKNVRKYITK